MMPELWSNKFLNLSCLLVCVTSLGCATAALPPPPRPLVFHHVEFAFDRAHLSSLARLQIAQNVQWMKIYDQEIVWLEGYTSSVGPSAYNEALGDRRVRAVAAAFIGAGIDPTRIAGMVSRGAPDPGAARPARCVEMQRR